MHHAESMTATAMAAATVAQPASMGENMDAHGVYTFKCMEVVPERKAEYDEKFQRAMSMIATGLDASALQAELATFPMQEKWASTIDNVVCTIGKNLLLDSFLTGTSFTSVGPYMGLISSVSFTAVAATDTMASHTGWTEAGTTNAPTFSARGTPAWSAATAGAKSVSTPVSFTMTSGGTLVGAFICTGTGAVTTIGSTAGTLLSAGAFTGGNQTVSTGNVVNVSYSLSV